MPLAETLAPSAGGALPLLTEEEKRRRLAAMLGLAPPMPTAAPAPAAASRSIGGGVEPIPNAMPGDARIEPIPNAVPGDARMTPLSAAPAGEPSPAYSPGPRMTSAPQPEAPYPGADGNVVPPINSPDLWPDPYRDRFGTPRAAAPAMELAAKPDSSAPMGSPAAEAARVASKTSSAGPMTARPVDEPDNPSFWRRAGRALGAAGIEFLNGGGILGAGQAAFMGAKKSQRGPKGLGAYGDIMEDRQMETDQRREALRMQPVYDQQERDRQAQLDEATIATKKAQAKWYGERGDLKRQELEAKALKATASEIRDAAKTYANWLLKTGQNVPAHVTKAATGYEMELTPEERYSIVAGADGVYAVNPTDPSDAQRIVGVPAKPAAGAVTDDVELKLRTDYGDPEGEADNPDFEAWRSSGADKEKGILGVGEEKAFRKAMYGRLMTPEEKKEGFVPPPDFESQLRARWNVLPESEKAVFYDQVQGAPKRKIKNSEKPGWLAEYKRRELEMRQKARNPGVGSAAPAGGSIPKTESEARAAAERAFPGDDEAARKARLLYMQEWSQSPR